MKAASTACNRDPLLCARELGVRIAGRWILQNVNLELRAGRVCAILGGNGAGKTTLLRALSGDLPADAGAVTLAGRPIHAWPSLQLAQHRAVLTQHDNLRFPFRVAEVVALAHLPWVGVEGRHGDDVVMAALRAAHADAFAQRIYTELSGGERARVRFARALAQVWDQAGAFLLLDEPLAHLDFAYKYRCLDQACKQAHDRRLGVVTILHDPNLAARYADDVVLLQEGRLVGWGATREWLTAAHLSTLYDCRVVCHGDPEAANGFFELQG
ncbi:MAG TPA: heme ABC transporter ATP-binding protein [Nevskiaceae bacterium]|nr:heme ABC transporter ATP-binding protein [Nevskiaceae bacterium]